MFNIFLISLFTFISITNLVFSQSPYGKVLVLKDDGSQNWIDIGTVLSNYITYHPTVSSPTWLTNGNAITSSAFFGTTNNQPLIFKTNNTEIMRLTSDGNLQISGALMPGGNAGSTGQILTSQGNGLTPIWTNLPSITENDPVYNSNIDASGASNLDLLSFNGTKFVPIGTGNITTSTSGITISGGNNAVIGTGTSIDIATANGTQNGLLSSSDWTSFNNTWSMSGNSLSGSQKFGSTNNYPVSIYTNNTEKLRISTKGQLEVYNTGWTVSIGEGAGQNDDGSTRMNTFIGYNSGYNNISGDRNVGLGFQSLYSNTVGRYNTAVGFQALFLNPTSNGNTALGYRSLRNNNLGTDNTGTGKETLTNNTNGSLNTANGSNALMSNTTGNNNVAVGSLSLTLNTTGNNNTSIGVYSLYYNNGNYNSALGYLSQWANTSGSYNTSFGVFSLSSNTSGFNNTSVGSLSLSSNTTGNNNSALGMYSLESVTTGSQNIAIGYSAGSNLTTGSNNIVIGFTAQPSTTTVSNEVTIGNSSNNSYRMYAASWTNASDARYKHNIEDLNLGIDFIMKLKPRQYIYNNSTDNMITLGFVAQEVKSTMDYFQMKNFNLVKNMENDYLGLNTTEIIPILVKAVQELKEDNDLLTKINHEYSVQLHNLKQEIERIKESLKVNVEKGSTK